MAVDKETLDFLIQKDIIKILQDTPEALETLVNAALNEQVDAQTGSSDPKYSSYNAKKIPWLQYQVNVEVRRAAENAIREEIAEKSPTIRQIVAENLDWKNFVNMMADAFLRTASSDWKINVNFDKEKRD